MKKIKFKCKCGKEANICFSSGKFTADFFTKGIATCICGEIMKEVKPLSNWTKLLIFLGLRCECGGRPYQPRGWDFEVCEKCGKKTYFN